MTERLLHVRTGRHPHEILILTATIVIGVVGALSPLEVSRSVAFVMQSWLAHFYYAGLAVFAGIALFGIFHKRIEGLLIERISITVVAVYYVIFAICVFIVSGIGGFMGALLPIAYCIANVARVWQIKSDLALIKSYLADHPGADLR